MCNKNFFSHCGKNNEKYQPVIKLRNFSTLVDTVSFLQDLNNNAVNKIVAMKSFSSQKIIERMRKAGIRKMNCK